MPDEAALRQKLTDLEATAKNQEYILSQAVHEAMVAGATWPDIGVALGVSPETAEARFGTQRADENPET